MPTIIDSLIVKLGLNSDDFVTGKTQIGKGLRELETEAKQTQKALDDAIKNGANSDTIVKLTKKSNEAATSLSNVQKAAKGQNKETSNVAKSTAQFLAVIGGTMAIKRFIENTIESSSALGRLSENLQTNVSTISAWSNATELAGGSASGLQGTMDMLSRSQTELMLTGQSSLIPYFAALGVSMADASGKARPLDDILLDLADRFSTMDRTTANNMGRMMGIDQGTLQLLLKGRTEVEAMISAQKEFGAVNQEQAEEAQRLQKTLRESQQTFAAFGRELLHEAMPAIEMILDGFSRLSNWAKENSTFVLTFISLLAAAFTALAISTAPISLTVIAIVALAAAIAELYTEYQKWSEGGGSTGLIDWNVWGPGIQGAIKGLKWLRDLLADLIYRAIAAAGLIGAIFAGDWEGVKFAAGEYIAGNGKKYGSSEEPEPTASKPETSVKPNRIPAGYKYDSREESPGNTQQVPKSKTEITQVEKDTVGFFQKLGWTLEQSIGIAANIKRESGFNHKAVGDSGQAFGLAQWHPDRQMEFQKRYGKPIQQASREEQLAFINYELTLGKEQKAGDKLRQAKTAEQSAAIISVYHERPRNVSGEAQLRAGIARNIETNITRGETSTVRTTQKPESIAAQTPSKPTSETNNRIAASPPSAPVVNIEQATRQPQLQAREFGDVANNSLLTAIAKAIATMMQFMMTVADRDQPKKTEPGRTIDAKSPPASVYSGIPGASVAAQGASAGQVAASQTSIVPAANNTSSVETNIAKIEVHTAATDAAGMSRDLANSQNWSFLSQANFGLA